MNKKVKKNLVLLISLSVTGLVSVVLLICALLFFFEWSSYSARTKAARDKVDQLRRQTPAPGRENEERIRKDIALYEEKGKDMTDNFRSPLRLAVDAFLQELPAPLPAKMTEEEIETYRVYNAEEQDADGDEENAREVTIRKFSYDDFRVFFFNRFEKFCEENNISEDNDRLSMTTLNRFSAQCVNLFPPRTWNRALNVFAEKARPLTYEPITPANQLAILLAAFGFPRRVENNLPLLQRQIDEIIEKRIVPMAEAGKLQLGDEALKFIGGSSDNGSLQVKDYPMAFFHWDVFGDIVFRLCRGKAASLSQVIVRTEAAEVDDEMGGSRQSDAINLEGSFEQDGNYRLYHYTVVFSGDMKTVREVLRLFDMAWKEQRMYVVRGVALYAMENGAAKVMKQVTEEDRQRQQETVTDDSSSRRRRRRGNEQSETPVVEQTVVLSEKEARESHYRVIMKRRREQGLDTGEVVENNEQQQVGDDILHTGNSANEGSRSAEEQERFYAELEQIVKPHERFGYSRPVVGKDGEKSECLVYLDIDYVVLEQNQ